MFLSISKYLLFAGSNLSSHCGFSIFHLVLLFFHGSPHIPGAGVYYALNRAQLTQGCLRTAFPLLKEFAVGGHSININF